MKRAVVTNAGAVAALVIVWVLLWGDLSPANVLSGIGVSIGLLIAFPLGQVEHVEHRFHLRGAVVLVVYFVEELVRSSLRVAGDVLRGPSAVRTGIVSCPLRVDSIGLVTFMANLIALSPGTMVIDVTRDPTVLHVHVLVLEHPDAVRARVAHLEELAVGAMGGPRALAAVRAPGAAS